MMVHLCIEQMRISSGHELHDQCIETALFSEEESKLAALITENMNEKLSIKMNKAEILSLVTQLSLLKITTNSESPKKPVDNNYFTIIVDSLLEDIKGKYLIDLTADEELRDNLTSHVAKTISRIENFTQTNNPILMLLKTEYPFVFEMSLYLYERIYEVFQIKLCEDELGYVSAYLGAAIERLENTRTDHGFSIAVVSN